MTTNESTDTRTDDTTAVRQLLQRLYAAWVDNDAGLCGPILRLMPSSGLCRVGVGLCWGARVL
jgi:hypothetical protein